MSDSVPSSTPGAGLEVALIAAGGFVLGLGFATFLGAFIAVALAGTNGTVTGGIDEWLMVLWRLAAGTPPPVAWQGIATGVPDGFAYWLPAGASYILLLAVTSGCVWAWRSITRESGRERFGQPTDARQATPNDVRPLRVKSVIPPAGRMLLGRMVGHPKILLATEDRERHPLRGKVADRQGNRGSVAMIGPTGSGKTANIIAAITTWDGPVVNVSVKRDLYDTTAAARSAVGEIAVFDPGAATGLPSARWSPLSKVGDSSGALRTGRALAQAIPRAGVSTADYWAKHGEKLLSAFMAVAGLSQVLTDGGTRHRVGMEQVSSWITMMTGDKDPIINDLLRRGLDDEQPLEIQLMARQAATSFIGLAKEDHKIRSSIYATAALAVDPWMEPAVAHSSTTNPQKFYNATDAWTHEPRHIDLDWLTSENNTLYLTASQPEFERLSPVLGGLLADLKDTLHAWDIAGRKLDKPLLIVIDEAGQLELGWLPAEVSTIASLGAFFVTAWQSLSQIQHRYKTESDAVLSGHRTKCFFAGIDDLATVSYLKGLLGSEHVRRTSHSMDIPSIFGDSRHRRSTSESVQAEEFAPANALRQMKPGEAVLLHGTLPPVHLEAIRWWKEVELTALIPVDDEGRATVPSELATCPLTDQPADTAEPVIDSATLRSALRALPRSPTPATPAPRPVRESTRTGVPVQRTQLLDHPADTNTESVNANAKQTTLDTQGPIRPVNARCDQCGRQLGRNDGRRLTMRGQTIDLCEPTCREVDRSSRE